MPQIKRREASVGPVLKFIAIEPASPILYGPLASQQLLVSGAVTDGTWVDVTRNATFSIEGLPLVKFGSPSVILPVRDGLTKLTARVGDLRASVSVAVNGAGDEPPHDFQSLVQPLLSRHGCSNANCHGAVTGQAGLKLSLFGYEPRADYRMIAEAENGRRVNTADPDHSLFLMKPTAQVTHGGGQRFTVNSEPYQSLREWIASGANFTDRKGSFVTGLKILPTDRQLSYDPKTSPEMSRQQLVVIASKGNGTLEDVTRKVKYLSNNEGVAEVSPDGLLSLHGGGDVAVMARYLGKIAVSRLTIVSGAPLPISGFPPPRNFIDEKVFAKLARLRTAPSGEVDDFGFLRRVYLDVTGQIPRRSDLREFLHDSRPDRRARLIDQLLESSDYVEFWSMKWADWLRNNVYFTRPEGQIAMNRWITDCVRTNRPYDRMVLDLLTASGPTFTEGPANYFRISGNPLDLATATSQLFTGMRLECARCHNHPFEKWTQADYYAFAAFFAEVRTRRIGEDPKSENLEIFDGTGGGIRNPSSGQVVPPRFLDGYQSGLQSVGLPLRKVLAQWLTAKENPYFARALVNRVWGELFGKGIVEPVDDFRATNPPSNPELLDSLAREFVTHGFDVKGLLRTILNSRTYQLSSMPNETNRRDSRNFSHHHPHRLSAGQLLDAINVATGVPEYYPGMTGLFRVAQLPGPQVGSYFLDIFGRCSRLTVGEKQRGGSMVQALELINGGTVNTKLGQPGGCLSRLLSSGLHDGQIIEELYLATLCRSPSHEEINRSEIHVLESRNRREGFQDVLWALINSKEFMNVL
ncbi:MAG: DUF1553 domain-containing protein [Armatimonadetes bacterium]|nr:DUF1553 domain-containing protein [Armatimonadota bacterium]